MAFTIYQWTSSESSNTTTGSSNHTTPSSNRTTVEEEKAEVKATMAWRELAIRNKDELTTICTRLRIEENNNKENEDDGNELEKERRRRLQAEEKVTWLFQENTHLKDCIQTLLVKSVI